LSIGADDYITKPYSIEELLLKIKNLLKRTANSGVAKKVSMSIVDVGGYRYNQLEHSLTFGGVKKVLTNKESEIVNVLAQSLGLVVKREEILKAVWGSDDYFNGRSLDVFITKVRRHFKQDERVELQNLHGIGYRLFIKE
jgi:DNA-binding response OmpR family regulator